MTYTTIESSVAEGRPYYLYQFIEGSEVWRFTSRAIDWTSPASGDGDLLWQATAISHGDVVQTSEIGAWRSRFRCRIPLRGGFSRRWATHP